MATPNRYMLTLQDRRAMMKLSDAAADVADGHFTVWRFTTNWKACVGTTGPRDIPSFATLAEAVEWAVVEGGVFYGTA